MGSAARKNRLLSVAGTGVLVKVGLTAEEHQAIADRVAKKAHRLAARKARESARKAKRKARVAKKRKRTLAKVVNKGINLRNKIGKKFGIKAVRKRLKVDKQGKFKF